MDFKLKGKSWAGNIYHQFESICQDVDGIMSKDTVKYVENQVQSVGVSVQNFYSNVVQDILPLVGDDVKHKAQSSTNYQVGLKDDVNSVTATRTESNSVHEEQPSMEQGSTDNFINSSTSLPIEPDDGMRFTKPPSSDSSQEAHIHLNSRDDADAMICNDANSCSEENITKSSLMIPENSSSKDELVSEMFDEDNKNSMPTTVPSPAQSDFHARLLAAQDEESSRYLSSDIVDYLSNISVPGWLLEDKMPKVVEGSTTFETPISPADKVHEDNRLSIDSPVPLANEDHEAPGKDEIRCDRFSNESSDVSSANESSDVSSVIQSSDLHFSYFSCNDEEDLGIVTSSCSTSPKSIGIVESTSGNFTEKAETTCNSESDCHGCANNVATSSSTTAAYETMDPSLSILESNDNCAALCDESAYVVAETESRHEEHENDINSNYSMLSSESGNKHDDGGVVGNLNLETVDLCDNAEHNRTSVILSGNISHAASHKRRNFRYYKKLIQEAFASQKRLSKEYEHLAIIYGDIDKESRQLFEPSSSPTSPASLHAAKLSLHENTETDWELL